MPKAFWLLTLLAVSLPPQFASAALSAEGVEDRLIIAFKPGVAAAERKQEVRANGLTYLDEIPALGVVLAQTPSGRMSTAVLRLKSDPNVLMVGPDIWRGWLDSEIAEAPLPSVKAVLNHLPKFAHKAPKADDNVQWGVARVNAPAAWPSNQGAGVKVAIVDTGIDPNQPKLHVLGGMNAIDENAPWADDHFHGTHVAGIVAAAMDGKPVVGVAPKASLYAVKVLTKEGKGDLFAIMKGISWCAQNGMQVLNMSLGAPQEMPLLQYALQEAVGAGVTVVAAAGNDGKAVNWPAAYPEAIAVSALCPTGVTNAKLCPSTSEGIATFSSRGPQVAFIAPGVLIPSTVPASNDPSGVHAYSGTSMATPHVTGLAALAVGPSCL